LLRLHGLEVPPDDLGKLVFKIGHKHEELMTPYLPNAVQEKLVSRQLTDKVSLAGHIDFLDDDWVYELKSVTSHNTYKSVFSQRKPKVANIAQLLTYMWLTERKRGKLIYSSWVKTRQSTRSQNRIPEDMHYSQVVARVIDEGIPLWEEQTEFVVEVTNDGIVMIDGVETEYKQQHTIDYWMMAAKVIESQTVYPEVPDDACHFCPFKKTCQMFRPFKDTTQGFLKSAEDVIEGKKALIAS